MLDRDDAAVTEHCSSTDVGAPPESVRRMRVSDVAGAASLHCRVFPDYFLTHMGQRFVEHFYSEFVERARNYGFVATSDGKLVGSVLGTLDYGGFFNHFYRRNFLRTAITLVGRFLIDPYIRRNLISRMAHVRRALCSIAARRQETTPSAEHLAVDPAPAHLLSIGIHVEKQGSGLAEQLVARYCEELWHDGIESVGLSVRPDNGRAIAFYEKTGWRRIGSSPSALQYTRSTRPRSVAGGDP